MRTSKTIKPYLICEHTGKLKLIPEKMKETRILIVKKEHVCSTLVSFGGKNKNVHFVPSSALYNYTGYICAVKAKNILQSVSHK